MIENGERVFSGADVGTDDILVSLPGALVPRAWNDCKIAADQKFFLGEPVKNY